MRLLSWWSEQSAWLRYGVALILLTISTFLFFAGTFWPWGWGIGVVMLLFAGPSDLEKKGYHF